MLILVLILVQKQQRGETRVLKYHSSTAARIRAIIEEKGFKQSAIAKKAGYRPSQVSHMLCGHRIITDNDCRKLAEAIGVNVSEFFN